MALNREENNDKNKQTTKTRNNNNNKKTDVTWFLACLSLLEEMTNVKILLFLSEIDDDGTVGKKKKKTKSHITDLIVAVFMSIS